MINIAVGVARFAEILFFAILSTAGVAIGAVAVGLVVAVVAGRRLRRAFRDRR